MALEIGFRRQIILKKPSNRFLSSIFEKVKFENFHFFRQRK
jgi:hypothetical protein